MIVFRNDENRNNNNIQTIEAHVKWYNPEKGYGFLTRDDGSSDIMIHFSVLHAMSCPYIKEGDRVICEIGPGRRGMQVTRVIEVKFESPEPRSLSDCFNSSLPPRNPEELEDIEGSIKWYNPDKGYGFICSDDGKREIFLHSSVLRRAGYKFLEPDIRVLAKIFTSERGPEAVKIMVIYEDKENQESA